MKDNNQMIRYLGFQTVPSGGRRLQFSVDTTSQTSVNLTITIAGAFFTGSERLSFQEAPGVCRTKLRRTLDAGTLHTSAMAIELTKDDVAQFRERSKSRRA